MDVTEFLKVKPQMGLHAYWSRCPGPRDIPAENLLAEWPWVELIISVCLLLLFMPLGGFT